MRLVKSTHERHVCALIPGRRTDKDGWVKTGISLSSLVSRYGPASDPEIELSAAAARKVGRAVDMVTAEEIEGYVERLRQMEDELSDLYEKVDALTSLRELEAA